MDTESWIILSGTAVLVGIGKIGFSGLSMITVSLFAAYFGKESVGVLLPLLVIADLTVYPTMRKYGSWRVVWPLLPPALAGMTIGLYLLKKMPSHWAEPTIGCMILMMLIVMLWKHLQPDSKLHHSSAFTFCAAFGGGISTTLANAAGPIIKIYLLAQNFPKLTLVGISARFFLLINILKLPLLGSISLISKESLWISLRLAPFVLVGILLGRKLLTLVPQKLFNTLIILFALIAVTKLLLF